MTWHTQEASWLDPLPRTPQMATAVQPARPLSPAARLKCRLCGQQLCVWGPDAGQPSGPRPQKLTRGEGRPQQAAGAAVPQLCGRALPVGALVLHARGHGPKRPLLPAWLQRTRRLAAITGGGHPGRRLDANTTSFNKPLVNSHCPQDMKWGLDPSLWVLRKTNTSLQLNPTWGPPKPGA